MTYYYDVINKMYLGTSVPEDANPALFVPVDTAPPETAEDEIAMWKDGAWVVIKSN